MGFWIVEIRRSDVDVIDVDTEDCALVCRTNLQIAVNAALRATLRRMVGRSAFTVENTERGKERS
jgi:hypothetical protein